MQICVCVCVQVRFVLSTLNVAPTCTPVFNFCSTCTCISFLTHAATCTTGQVLPRTCVPGYIITGVPLFPIALATVHVHRYLGFRMFYVRFLCIKMML